MSINTTLSHSFSSVVIAVYNVDSMQDFYKRCLQQSFPMGPCFSTNVMTGLANTII